jgi:hypothetical protein
MRTNPIRRAAVAALLLAVGGTLELARAAVPASPPAFSNPLTIDNKYDPFVPFRIRVYELVKGKGDLVVLDVFKPDTRTFTLEDGTEVECATLEEWEIEEGEIVEISQNWFAQSDDGTVWYFGETVDTYENGQVTGHGGSWLVGGPGAGDPAETVEAKEPAVFMPGDPEVGDQWKSEDLPDAGIEEFNEVIRFVKRVRVPACRFRHVLEIRGETPDVETKWYAPHLGFIKAKEGRDVLALIDVIDSEDEEEMQEELEEILEGDCEEDD